MKFFVLFLLATCVSGDVRVKRIVGGLKAAIPAPVNFNEANLPDEEPGDESSLIEKKPNQFSNDGLDNVVAINEDTRSARVTGTKEANGQISFKGIRYAEPPLGRNRFVRPIIKYMNGELNATEYGHPCVQISNSLTVGNEDCLFLNVYTPSVKATGLPVLFWIHGGGFKSGSGNQYGASSLVSKNIVVVTLNYRLGTFGFLGTNSKAISGNSALFDIRAAFEWTRKYVSYFGGSPNKIFPAGQGSGASVATLFAQSSFTADHIKGVIAMSGSSLSSTAINYSPGDIFSAISSKSQCPSNEKPLQIVRCLQKDNTNDILNIDSFLQKKGIKDGGFVSALTDLLGSGPVIEGQNDGRSLPNFLTENPLNALQTQHIPKVPLFIGTTKQETGKLISGSFFDEVVQKTKDPNFLSKSLPISLLQNNKGLFANGSVNALLDNLFKNGDYLKLISSTVSEFASSIAKVIEQTTDALFNLPAVTLSLLWKKVQAPVYYYSFEHAASLDSPITFLDNPLYSSAKTKEKVVGHGDDLIFLFELQSLYGTPIPGSELKTPEDIKVKEIYVNTVAEFLHSGKPKVPGLNQDWPEFGDENNYVTISPQPYAGKRYRYCQLALWGGFVEKLTDQFCNFPGITDILKQIPNINELLKNNLLGNANINIDLKAIASKLTSPLSDKKGGLPVLGGGSLLGGGSKNKPSGTTQSTGGSLLGGLKPPGQTTQTGGLFGGFKNKPSGQTTHLRVTLIGS